MLIGLYMITPIIKPFAINATDKEIWMALGVLFILSSLLPTMNQYGAGMTGYMMLSTPYIFIYLLGYALCWRKCENRLFNKGLLVTICLLCFIIIIAKCYCDVMIFGYANPVIIILAAVIFLLFKDLKIEWKVADKLSKFCFAIYLIHPVFINFIYKFLNIETGKVVPCFNFIGFFLLFTALSIIGAYILMKIPLLKKHVL